MSHGNAPHLLTENIGFALDPTPEQVERATRTVCAHAANVTEARELLQMLGLI